MFDISLVTEFEILDNTPVIISTGKSLGFMKIENNKIEIYKSNFRIKSTEFNETILLSNSLKKKTLYKIGFNKTINGVTFFLKGGDISFEKYYGVDDDVFQNAMRGQLFFEVHSGNIKVYKSYTSSNYNKQPKVSIYGDSFVEGVDLKTFGSSLNNRWCVKFANEIGINNCFIDGKGGESLSKEWLNRMKLENTWFKSEYVILCLGTNNYKTINDYIAYMSQAITYLKNNNQVPILVTVTPHPDFEYNLTAGKINNWVIASGEKYIDFHKALTKSDDVSQWEDRYIQPDGIHPTVLGYNAMYNQLKKDCPYIFDDI
ncbi:SGNH/GDSL hydrolase family protein [Flavobacterium branchiicola]|uniref:SGNH/GDSL hydrolase family protein n=1 Tax=Flavobacterium branchiicola TaxID=1114875 RepID=A0ABV9PGK3_9FLAO|nr:SGNH/GDSL hydrolase family protein [Flavobacterium branchiicola]MBS7255041.1 SGNH/GDSL hydrolase family protein [Flavobacterium branchiicola]